MKLRTPWFHADPSGAGLHLPEESQLISHTQIKHQSSKQTHSKKSQRKMKRQISRWFMRFHEATGRSRRPSRIHVNYLLSWCDVGIDVFEDRLEHGIVAHAQVLDLDLTTLGPVLGHLRGVCTETNTAKLVNTERLRTVQQKTDPLAASLLSILEAWLL